MGAATTPWRAIIKVTYACNNRCLFCHASGEQRLPALAEEEARRRIARAAAIGATGVLFSGGEPTLRKDLPQLFAHCRKLGLTTGLITNGRMLSYVPLLRRLLKQGLDYVYLSLHGPEAVHDEITQAPGSFAQTLQAISLLQQARSVELTVNAVVVRRNLASLGDLVRLLAPFSRARIKFTYVEPKGSALDDPELLCSPEEATRAVVAALEVGQALGLPLARFGVDGLPHCLDGRFGALQDDMFSHGIYALREGDEEDFFPIDYGNMSKPEVCRGCLLGDGCRGTWRRTLERYGEGALRPRYGSVPNSYNYFPAQRPGEEVDPDRTVLVDRGGEPQAWFTDTGDYGPTELRRIRDEQGQLYLQQDDAPVIDDFPRQLRKLRPAGTTARGVPLFAPLSGDPFGAAEARVRRILAGLGGDVLDVGCGQTRYADLLNEKLAAGTVRYVGVDPVPGEEVKALAAAGRVDVRAAPVEALALEPGSVDWVLVLRSHNHLADLWTAYSRMVGALRWGGHLLVVDNVSFGLLRPANTRPLVEALPRTGGGHEHLRDHSAAEAADFLRRFPLRPVERYPVTTKTANQWLLLYKKVWPGGQLGKDSYVVR